MIKWKFWKRKPSLNCFRNFPIPKSTPPSDLCKILFNTKFEKRFQRGEVAIIAFIAGIVAKVVGYGWTSYMIATVIVTVVKYALIYGTSIWGLLSSSKKSQSSFSGNGQLVNGHLASDTIKICYGTTRVGGTWAFFKSTSRDVLQMNNYLHVVVVWCEGEVEGIGKALEQPVFHGYGLDDMSSRGVYTGATFNKFRVQIDHIGATDSFKWNDTGSTSVWNAEDVAITGGWQTLSNGAEIKFKAITGHTTNQYWDLDGVDGSWGGDRVI